MVEGAWRRRLLGLAVATVVPIAVGGAACSGTDLSPEPVAGAAGVAAASGSSAGGSAAGGSSAGKNGASGSGSAGTAAAAGSESVGGSTTAGNDAGGNATGGDAGGHASGGATAGGFPSGGNAAGGHASGEDGSCCGPGDTDACTQNGKALKTCTLVPGGDCPETALYSHVWHVQVCANGCDSGGTGGAAGRLSCH